MVTNNAGRTWSYLGNNVGNIITAVIMVSLTELYATTNDGSVLYSSNNGGSWATLYKLKDIYFSNLYFRTRNVGVITGYTNTVLITKDAGVTFANVYPGLNAYYDQCFISISDTIFLVGTNRAIIKSSDYGTTWTLLNTNLGTIPNDIIHFYGIFMFNLNIGFIVGEKGCILKTINGGVSWTFKTITVNDLKSIIMIDQNNIITVGSNGEVFSSKDSGNKWAQIPSGTTQNLNYINIISNTLRICGNGFISKLTYNSNNIYLPIGTLNITSPILYRPPEFNLFDVASGMVLWLDANDTSTLILDNNLLLQWNDKSGFNRNATKYGTDISYPNYVFNGFNNLPGIQFNSNQGFSVPMPYNTFTTGVTIFVVFKVLDTSVLFDTGLISRGYNDKPAPFDMYGSTRLQGNGITSATGTSNFNLNNAMDFNIMMIKVSANNWTENLNGTQIYSANITGLFSDHVDNNKLFIGTRYDNKTTFIGIISEIIVYKSILTTPQTQLVEGYLAKKWAMLSRLPSNHPYSNGTLVTVDLSANIVNTTLISSIITNNARYNLNILAPDQYKISANYITPNNLIFLNSTSISSPMLIQPVLSVYGMSKTYDGTTKVILSLSGILNRDINNIFISNYNANYNDSNVNNDKLITYYELILGGSAVMNYVVPQSNGYTLGNIFKKEITPLFIFNDKYYDGTPLTSLSGYILNNVLWTDISYIDISNTYFSMYKNKNVGYNIIDISNIVLIGSKSNNYFIKSVQSASNILKKPLTFNVNDKYYDKSSNVTLTLSGLISGDYYNYTAIFDTYEPNMNINVTISSIINNNPNQNSLLFNYTFNIETVNNILISNYDGEVNGKLSTTTNIIDTNNQLMGTGCLYLSQNNFMQINKFLQCTISGLSFSVWIKPTSSYGNTIFDFGTKNVTGFGIALDISNSLTIILNNARIPIYTNNLTTNIWKNLIWTIENNSNYNVYLDGTKIYTSVPDYSLDSDPSLVYFYTFETFDNLLVYNNATDIYDGLLTASGIINSSSYIVGNNSLVLNGINASMSLLSNLNITNNGFTIAFWFKTSSSGSDSRLCNFATSLTPNNDLIDIYYTSNNLNIKISVNGTNYVKTITDTNLNNNTWVHIGFVCMPTYWLVYINGTLKFNYTTGISYPRLLIRNNNTIGRIINGSNYLTGNLDDFRFYNRALTSPEFLKLYVYRNYGKYKVNSIMTNLYIGKANFKYYNYNGYIDDFRVYNRTINTDEIIELNKSKSYSFNNQNNNYTLIGNNIGNIFQRPLNITINDKIYDGQIDATYNLTNVLPNDNVTISGFVYYENANAGTNKLVTISGFLIGSLYYTISSYIIKGTITQKVLTPQFDATKIYDGTRTISSLIYTISGILNNDIVYLNNNYNANYISSNTGSQLAIISNLSLFGKDISNYTISSTLLFYSNILKNKVTAQSLNKIYDGTTIAPININGLFGNDKIQYTSNYNDKKADIGKTITVNLNQQNTIIATEATSITVPFNFFPQTLITSIGT